MGKIFLKAFLLVLLTNLIGHAQTIATLPAYESFDYASGTKLIEDNQTVGIGSWGTSQPRTTDAVITASPDWSSVAGLINPQGKALAFGGSGDNPDFVFTQQSGFGSNPVKIYTSFVMTATRLDLLDATEYRLFGFGRLTTSDTFFGAGHIFVRGADFVNDEATGYNLGVNGSNSTSGITWDTTIYRKDEILSIVLYYDSGAGGTGGSGEFARLWVNPTLTGTEPTPTVVSTTVRTSNIDRIQIQQNNGANTPYITLDELRVGLNWDDVTKITNTYTWTGSTDNDWATATNWDSGVVPTGQDNVVIPVSSTPVISSTTGAKAYDLTIDASASLSIAAEGSLRVVGTATGDITYNVNVTDTNWHLISSPVTNETYNDAWVTANNIQSGSAVATNRGISTYDNTSMDINTGYWRYMQQGDSNTFNPAQGYALLRSVAGDYSFTGLYNSNDIGFTITQSDSNWNLIGNPYPSYINIEEFIAANASAIDDSFEAIYVWDASLSSYTALTSGYLQPGQAFFVNSALSSSTVNFTENMQSHQTAINFYRQTVTDQSIELTVTSNNESLSTIVNFYQGTTKGLDPGLDLGLFSGESFDFKVYTHLLEDNVNVDFKKQALPKDAIEDAVIPVGIKAVQDSELTFSATQFNLPTGISVYLEDTLENTYTELGETGSSYSITLSESINGTGRFFLHTKSKSLHVDEQSISSSMNVYAINNQLLKITGIQSEKIELKLHTLLGKQVYYQQVVSIDESSKDVQIPVVSSGIYIVQLETEKGSLNKKIIIK